MQTWLVTGGSRGLGREVVAAALAAGHRVIGTARNVSSLDEFVSDAGDRFLGRELDVTNHSQVADVVAEGINVFGGIDVVVNNAGYADMAAIEEMSMESFTGQVDAVFMGTVAVTKAVLPHMVARGSGTVIQVTSVGGRLTAPGLGAYQAAKFAVEGFSRVLATEVGPLGVHVVLAEPGGMRTDWAGDSMSVAPIADRYAPTVGVMVDYLRSTSGAEGIDPVKVAEVFLELATMDEPPVHLLLGQGTIEMVEATATQLLALDAENAAITNSVNYD